MISVQAHRQETTIQAPTLSRRKALGLLCATAAASLTSPEPAQASPLAAWHQVEGNLVNDDCWLLEHLPNSIFFKEPSGDACD